MDEIDQRRAVASRVAAFGLEGSDGAIEVDPRNWHRLVSLLRVERLTGLAVAAADADALRLTDAQSEELRAQHLDDMTWTVALERALLHIAQTAEQEGVGPIVLKGPVLAHCFYPDPSWRAFADIDMLVRTNEWRRACALLDRLGFRRQRPEPRAGFDERFGKAAVHLDAQGLNVDLHRTLVLGPFGLWMQPEELFERTIPFRLAGVTLRRLDDTALLLHACIHASLGFMDPLLMPLRDLVQISRLGTMDWDEFGRLASRWRLRSVVRHAFDTVEHVLGVETPPEPLAACAGPVSHRERRALDSYVTSKRARGGTARSSLMAVPGARNKARLLRAMLFPDHAFLAARAGTESKPSYLRRWSVPVRWLLRRTR